MPREDVVALYVDRLGPYPKLVREWYDEARDARTYAGPWPIVAHPPCGPWGSLRKHWSRGQADIGLMAFQQVRRFGGVLVQPAYSRLFEACRAPRPGEFADEHGGISIEVRQVDWGHPAVKLTWLYCVECEPVGPMPPRRQPTHWCSGVHTPGARGQTPPGIKVCSAQQWRRTPVAFAEWLLDIAARARRTEAADPIDELLVRLQSLSDEAWCRASDDPEHAVVDALREAAAALRAQRELHCSADLATARRELEEAKAALLQIEVMARARTGFLYDACQIARAALTKLGG